MMNRYELEDKEQSELEAIEHALEASPSQIIASQKKELKQYAKNTLNKTRHISIRISERDLQRLKAKAIDEGIPYQTLASSILHKTAAK
jgi:predicted DNA binding CopG/RHH family protein